MTRESRRSKVAVTGPSWLDVLRSDPAAIERILGYIEDGIPPVTAFRVVGLPAELYRDWAVAARSGRWRSGKDLHPETASFLVPLFQEIDKRLASFEHRMASTITDAAPKDWKAAAFHLTHGAATRYTYFEHHPAPNISVTLHPPGPEHEAVAQLSDHALIELGGDEWRELIDSPPTQ